MPRRCGLIGVLLLVPATAVGSPPASDVQNIDPSADLPVWDAVAFPSHRRWLATLPVKIRRTVKRACTQSLNQLAACDGIGPYHVAASPPMLPGRGMTMDQIKAARRAWLRAMPKRARAWVNKQCNPTRPEDEDDMYSDLCAATPLVVAFGDASPELWPATDLAPWFAFTPGTPVATDWPTAATPWLARDLDGNGRIDGGHELFGRNTALPSGATAAHGFAALAPLDTDRDRQLTADELRAAGVVLWRDADGDRQSTATELTLAADELAHIDLGHGWLGGCDARRNCLGEVGTMVTRDGAHGRVIDVYLRLHR